MLESILEFDRQLFLLLNGAHTAWLDPIMKAVSAPYTWLPMYVVLLILFFVCKPKWQALAAVGAVLLCFFLTDRISVECFKDVFQRLRPTHEPSLQGLVHALEGQGGLYGFVSSHAANLFGLATVSCLIIRKKWLTITLFSFVTLIGYSRVYVGKHYPLDVICGALLGLLLGWIVYRLYRWLCQKYLIPKKH